MKKIKLALILLSTLLAGSLLSGCTGGAGLASSWPGLTVDLDSELVYLAMNTHVHAVNLANGSEKWRFPEKADNKITFFAAPALTDQGQLVAGAYDHALYSLQAENGQQVWSFKEATDKFVGPALANGEMIYAPNANYSLYALDSRGSLRWQFKTAQALWAKPLANGGQVYLASMDHHVYALDPESGREIWKTEDLGGAIVSSFSLGSDGVLYVGTLGSNLAAVDTANGSVLWNTKLGGWVWAKPLIKDGTVYLGDQSGIFYALDAQTGSVRWQIQPDPGADRALISSPVLVEDTLYFGSQAGILYAVDAASGSPRWNKTLGGKIYADLALAGDKILIAPSEFDSALLAVDLLGNPVWNYTPAK